MVGVEQQAQALSRAENPHAPAFHQLGVADAHSGELTACEEKTAARPAMFGNFFRDQNAPRLLAIVHLEFGRFDQPRLPARQFAAVIDTD
jgi:hypothetical protein